MRSCRLEPWSMPQPPRCSLPRRIQPGPCWRRWSETEKWPLTLLLSRCHLKTNNSRKFEPLRLLTHLLGCFLFYSLAHSFTYLITHSITCSFTHSLSYSLISLRVSVDVKQHFSNNSILGLLYFAFWVRAQSRVKFEVAVQGSRP